MTSLITGSRPVVGSSKRTYSGATVSAHNLSGGIDADFGRPWRASTGHRLEASVNGGGAAIRLQNVNGGISIQSPWSRRVRPAS